MNPYKHIKIIIDYYIITMKIKFLTYQMLKIFSHLLIRNALNIILYIKSNIDENEYKCKL